MVTHTLFIAHTPYHVLLSLGMAKQDDQLFIVTDFDDAELFEQTVRKHYGSFLSVIRTLPGRKTAKEVMWRRVLVSRKNKKAVRKQMDHGDVGEVVIFNDRTVEGQYAAYLAHVKGLPMAYAEDGLAAYIEPQDVSRSAFKDTLAKLLFGTYFDNVKVMGTSKWVTRAKLLFPSLAIPQLGSVPLEAIDKGIFRNISPGFLQDMTAGVDDDIEMMIVLPHTEMLKTTTTDQSGTARNDYSALIVEAQGRHQKVGIKYHPRETNEFIKEYNGCQVLPKHVPIELIYLKQRQGGVKEIASALSTSLYTARVILGDEVKIKVMGGNALGQRFLDELKIEVQ